MLYIVFCEQLKGGRSLHLLEHMSEHHLILALYPVIWLVRVSASDAFYSRLVPTTERGSDRHLLEHCVQSERIYRIGVKGRGKAPL